MAGDPRAVETLDTADLSEASLAAVESTREGAADSATAETAFPGSGFGPRFLRVVILAATDVLTILLAGFFAYLLWANLVRSQPPAVYLQLIPMLALFLVAFAVGGLYPGFGLGAAETLRRLWLLGGSVFLVAASSSFALRVPHHYSRMAYIITVSCSLVGLPVARFVVLSFLQRTRWWGEPVVVVGTGRLARETIRLLEHARSLGYRPVQVIAETEEEVETELEGIPVVSGLSSAETLSRRGIRTILVVPSSTESQRRLVDFLQFYFRHVLLIRGESGGPVEGVEVRNLGGILAIEFRNQLLKRRNRIIKRSVPGTMQSKTRGRE